MTDKKVRVRMAPSPTGFMHIGTLRTLLYDYLYARQNDGDFVLRVEDTDQSRSVDGALENLLAMLDWTGLNPDEGPYLEDNTVKQRGEHGPYIQSERKDLYAEYALRLVDQGDAYHCFCTSERLDEMRKQQQKEGRPTMYDRTCAHLAKDIIEEKITNGEPYVIRMRVPREEEIIVDDLVRGRVIFQGKTVDDQVILKSDGFPTYHLAVVVDDHLMDITHIFRGEEWLPSTPKHIILYKMLDFPLPAFAHLPLLLNADKSKLSKRQGDVAVEDYVAKGYLKEAIINFVALLGWNPGGGSTEEIFTLEELVEKFSLTKVHKAGAVVDVKRLNWINAHYIKNLSIEDLYERALPFVREKDFYANWEESEKETNTKKLLTLEQDRLERLVDLGEENGFLFSPISYEPEILVWKENTLDDAKAELTKAKNVLEGIEESDWTRENITEILMETAGDKRGDFLWPLRAALTGEKRSPSPMDCAWFLGKEETLYRIEQGLQA